MKRWNVEGKVSMPSWIIIRQVWIILMIRYPILVSGCQEVFREWSCSTDDKVKCYGKDGQYIEIDNGGFLLNCNRKPLNEKLIKCLPGIPAVGHIRADSFRIDFCSLSNFQMKDFLSGQNASRIELRSSVHLNVVISGIPLEELYIEDSWNMNKFEITLDNLPLLTDLTIQRHGFVNFSSDVFQHITNVRYLTIIYGQNLASLPDDIFFHLTAVESLNLYSNTIVQISALMLRDLKELNQVDLSRNKITQLPSSLFMHSPYLRTVRFSNNQLTEIQDSTFDGIDLFEIDLSNNPYLSVLPKSRPFGSGSPIGLKVSLSNCNLTEIPDIDWQTLPLRKLDLSGNSITNPILPIYTKRKTEVNLERNNISTIILDLNSTSSESPVYSIKENALTCDCQLETFLKFLHSKRQKDRGVFTNESLHLKCRSPRSTEALIEICPQQQCELCNQSTQPGGKSPFTSVDIAAKTGSLIGAGLAVLCAGTLLVKKKDDILAVLNSRIPCCPKCIACRTSEQSSYDYDGFVCYHPDNSDIVNAIISVLEPDDFRLNVLGRDETSNLGIKDSILDAMQKSRKIILILSPTFVESPLFKEHFLIAYGKMPMDNAKKVIPIFVGDFKGATISPSQVMKVLLAQSPMKWGERFFWDKLKYYLQRS